MAASQAIAGPSRPIPARLNPPPAPSTSGDSESTAAQPVEKGLEVGVLKELAREALIESLNDIQGAKTLILDPALAGPLGLITEITLLKHQAVDKLFWLEPGPLSVSTRNVVWLCRPKLSHMRTIAEQIRSQQSSPAAAGPLVYTILLVPRATELCRKVLEDEGVAGDINISEFRMEFVPLEEDLLSMEMEDVARDIFLNGDDTPIFYSSLALMTFQRAFGLFPRILGKGDGARKLSDLLQRHYTAGDAQYAELETSDQVDSLIILDRSVDWVTPMCTQLTYEGMLDEYVGIRNGHIEVDPALLETDKSPAPTPGSTLPPAQPTKKRKHHLSGQKDKLLADIRDLNFAIVGSRLSKLARRLEGDYGGVKNLKSVSEMKQFVGKISGLQSEQQNLRLHTGLTEQLMAITKTDEFDRSLEAQQNIVAGYDTTAQLVTIDDLLSRQIPWASVLRIAVLLSLTNGGIKPKPLEAFKRDFLQVYGYHHLPLLVSLESLNLLVKSPTSAPHPFPALRKSLRLVVDDIDDAAPNDISYVYSGYAPLSVRLVQCVTQKNTILSTAASVGDINEERDGRGRKTLPRAHPILGWRGFEDVLASIPGPTVDVRQKVSAGRHDINGIDSTTTVVFFLGGCTYTEIAALRWMSKQTKGRRFLIATTGIINGTTLLESFGDKPPVALHT
ncbi:putative ATP binding protein [Naematelia encephala]|uniref:Putative ATP binding protein n=1 Tax=Naematelia encephala TaxID=71784 RepID=A0A1Y2BL95_9TREE|nr:putative ATP binding protein [Naematelia encephala]